MTTPNDDVLARLEHLRSAIHAENISYGELSELQSLVEYIDPSDVELLQWAGVPEFPDDEAAQNDSSVSTNPKEQA